MLHYTELNNTSAKTRRIDMTIDNLRRIDMKEKYFWAHKCLGTHAS